MLIQFGDRSLFIQQCFTWVCESNMASRIYFAAGIEFNYYVTARFAVNSFRFLVN